MAQLLTDEGVRKWPIRLVRHVGDGTPRDSNSACTSSSSAHIRVYAKKESALRTVEQTQCKPRRDRTSEVLRRSKHDDRETIPDERSKKYDSTTVLVCDRHPEKCSQKLGEEERGRDDSTPE